jgi:hypothetical protein
VCSRSSARRGLAAYRAHELTREERARGGYVKAAKRRFRAELLDAADRIVEVLHRVGEEDAAHVVQELFLPHTLERPWESTRNAQRRRTPAQERRPCA